jgi:hypothetical protein
MKTSTSSLALEFKNALSRCRINGSNEPNKYENKAVLVALIASIQVMATTASAQQAQPMASNAPEQSIEKLREEFLNWKFGMFLHFNLGTFSIEKIECQFQCADSLEVKNSTSPTNSEHSPFQPTVNKLNHS